MAKKQTQQLNENKKLTPEQKEFCREVANGLSPRLAYIKSFDCKESAASACASRMLKRANVDKEISRLRKKAHEVHAARTEGQENRKLWTKAERMERLQEWAEQSASVGKINDATRCVDLLNKMDGSYEVTPINEQSKHSEAVEAADERELRSLAEMTAELMAQVESEDYESERNSH